MKQINKHVTIFGAGPAGLFCAYQLINRGIDVSLYDHQGGVGKKFLVAGHGGLNLTHSEDITTFSQRYDKNQIIFEDLLNQFSPQDLRDWCHQLGVETFIGTSGRVFPVSLKSSEILFIWLNALKQSPHFKLYLKHKLIDLNFKEQSAKLLPPHGPSISVHSDAFVFALGGASWKKTGSDGNWTQLFLKNEIKCAPFQPVNCGFQRNWSSYFKDNIDRYPLKNISLSINQKKVMGEMMLTPYGVEGTSVYALSKNIRDEINLHSKATLHLDLRPQWSLDKVHKQLSLRKKKVSKSAYLNKVFKFSKQVNILLKELLKPEDYEDDNILAKNIKSLPITVSATRPIDEAISTSGGIAWSEVDSTLQLKRFAHNYIIGEMLDFDAPTGGYLLQGAFSSSYVAAKSIIKKLAQSK